MPTERSTRIQAYEYDGFEPKNVSTLLREASGETMMQFLIKYHICDHRQVMEEVMNYNALLDLRYVRPYTSWAAYLENQDVRAKLCAIVSAVRHKQCDSFSQAWQEFGVLPKKHPNDMNRSLAEAMQRTIQQIPPSPTQ